MQVGKYNECADCQKDYHILQKLILTQLWNIPRLNYNRHYPSEHHPRRSDPSFYRCWIDDTIVKFVLVSRALTCARVCLQSPSPWRGGGSKWPPPLAKKELGWPERRKNVRLLSMGTFKSTSVVFFSHVNIEVTGGLGRPILPVSEISGNCGEALALLLLRGKRKEKEPFLLSNY